jgi:hypothetical protein
MLGNASVGDAGDLTDMVTISEGNACDLEPPKWGAMRRYLHNSCKKFHKSEYVTSALVGNYSSCM